MKKNVLILLDNGHGGIIDGVYQTPGKRSPVWSDGSQLFEGEFNRDIVKALAEQLRKHGIDVCCIVPEEEDISLSDRVARANNLYINRPDGALCYLLSIHANAGGGEGFEIFTSKGDTQADPFADCIAKAYEQEFPAGKLRSDLTDGDLDKESNFYILRNTKMPAVLAEIGFMDNENECRNLLMTNEGKARIVKFLVAGVLNGVGMSIDNNDSVKINIDKFSDDLYHAITNNLLNGNESESDLLTIKNQITGVIHQLKQLNDSSIFIAVRGTDKNGISSNSSTTLCL